MDPVREVEEKQPQQQRRAVICRQGRSESAAAERRSKTPGHGIARPGKTLVTFVMHSSLAWMHRLDSTPCLCPHRHTR